MQLIRLLPGVVVVVGAVLAGCGGGYSGTSAPIGTPIPTVAPSPTANPSQTTTTTFPAAGGTVMVGPYANAAGTNISLTSVWGTSNQSSITFTSNLSNGANNGADVIPANPSWVPFTGTGNLVTYLEFTAFPATVFNQSPQLTFTLGGAVAGSSCTLSALSGSTWQTLVTGGTLTNANTTITFAAGARAGTFNVGLFSTTNGPLYMVLTCQ